jgi:ankyrin repeat protein
MKDSENTSLRSQLLKRLCVMLIYGMEGLSIATPLRVQSSPERIAQTPKPKLQKLKNGIDPIWEEIVRRKQDFGPFAKDSLSRQREYLSQSVPVYLAQGGRENASTIYDFSVLHGAAFSGQEVLFNSLWQPNRLPHQQLSSLLLAAAQGGNAEIFAAILKQGANPNARNYQGDTPLHTHTKDPYSVIERLIQKGADVNAQNAQGDIPLHKAVSPSQWDHPSPEVAKLLLLQGVNPKLKNRAGLTPWAIALKSKNLKLIKNFN